MKNDVVSGFLYVALLLCQITTCDAAEQESVETETQRINTETMVSLAKRPYVLQGLTKLFINQANLTDLALKEFVDQLRQIDIPKQSGKGLTSLGNDEASMSISSVPSGSGVVIELEVHQMCRLDRDPKHVFSALTYGDTSYVNSGNQLSGVREVMSRFVINYLKANSTIK